MRIIMTTKVSAKYGVKDGKIYYVELSRPNTVSDPNDPYTKYDITPYLDQRVIYYGVFVEDSNGYSARAKSIKRISNIRAENADEIFEMCCSHYGCNLSWEEAKKLAGWC